MFEIVLNVSDFVNKDPLMQESFQRLHFLNSRKLKLQKLKGALDKVCVRAVPSRHLT